MNETSADARSDLGTKRYSDEIRMSIGSKFSIELFPRSDNQWLDGFARLEKQKKSVIKMIKVEIRMIGMEDRTGKEEQEFGN